MKKMGLTDVIKVRILDWGNILGYPGGYDIITKILTTGRQRKTRARHRILKTENMARII